MRVVEIGLRSMHDGQSVRGTLVIEKRNGDKWTRIRAFVATSGEPSRRLWLEDDQRIVIEAEADQETVFDKYQNMAYQQPKDRRLIEALERERRELNTRRRSLDREISEEAKREATRRVQQGDDK